MIGGSALVQRVFIAGMAATAGAGVWMGWMGRTRRMTVRKTTIAWFIIGIGACCTMLYYGLISAPALGTLPFSGGKLVVTEVLIQLILLAALLDLPPAVKRPNSRNDRRTLT